MIVGIATECRLWQSIAARTASWNRGVTRSVVGIIRGKSSRTQLSVTPPHCVSEVPVAPEKCHFFSFAEYLIACNGERESDSYPEEFECEQTAGDQN